MAGKSLTKSFLLTIALLICLSRLVQGFIQGFTIDDSGTYGRDCELYSGSVTSKSISFAGPDFLTWFLILWSYQLPTRQQLRGHPVGNDGEYNHIGYSERVQRSYRWVCSRRWLERPHQEGFSDRSRCYICQEDERSQWCDQITWPDCCIPPWVKQGLTVLRDKVLARPLLRVAIERVPFWCLERPVRRFLPFRWLRYRHERQEQDLCNLLQQLEGESSAIEPRDTPIQQPSVHESCLRCDHFWRLLRQRKLAYAWRHSHARRSNDLHFPSGHQSRCNAWSHGAWWRLAKFTAPHNWGQLICGHKRHPYGWLQNLQQQSRNDLHLQPPDDEKSDWDCRNQLVSLPRSGDSAHHQCWWQLPVLVYVAQVKWLYQLALCRCLWRVRVEQVVCWGQVGPLWLLGKF